MKTFLKILVASAALSAAAGCSEGRSAPTAERVDETAFVHVPMPVPSPTQTAAPTAKEDAGAAAPKRKVAKEAPKRDGADLKIKRLVVAKGVERKNREPIEPLTGYKKGDVEKVYAFVEVENPGEASEVVVSFDPPGDAAERGLVTLDVGRSPRWRTWAFSRGLDQPGKWAAVVRSKSGKELGRTEFEVTL